MLVKLSHSEDPVEVDGLMVKINDNEFLIKQKPEGLHIIESLTPHSRDFSRELGGKWSNNFQTAHYL